MGNLSAGQERLKAIYLWFQQGQLTASDAAYLIGNPTVNIFQAGGVSGLKATAAGSLGPPASGRGAFQASDTTYSRSSGRGAFQASDTTYSQPTADLAGGPGARNFTDEVPFEFFFQNVEGYETPADFGTLADRVVLPVTPERIEVSTANSASTVTTVAGFSYSHAGVLDLEKISFESFLPAGLSNIVSTLDLPTYVTPRILDAHVSNEEPEILLAMLHQAEQANQPLLFGVTDPSSGDVIPAMKVTIQSLTYSWGAGQGTDATFSITLQRWYPQELGSVSLATTYVTGPKDHNSCVEIAQHIMGKDNVLANAGKIKKRNKKVIDADRKRRANKTPKERLFFSAGLTLQIPPG